MSERVNLYVAGEERFGYFSSRLYSFFSGMAVWKAYRQIIDYVLARRPATLLDVGCGPGDLMIRLSREMKETSFVGIDPSPQMVRVAARKIARNGLSTRIQVKQGSSRYPYLDRKFGMIISSFSFHHWKNQKEGLSILMTGLESGGELSIFDMNADGFYGKVPVVRKHALSVDLARELKADGHPCEVEFSQDSRLIILSCVNRN